VAREAPSERLPADPDRLYKTEAVVLKQASIGEADRLLTLYTPHHGKLRAVARGVRRTKSKLSGHVEPLVHCRLLLVRGRTMDVVSQAETVSSFTRLRSNLEATARAVYSCELVDAFAPDAAANPGIFALLLSTLGRLDDGEQEVALRWYELRLLQLTGFRPELRQCAECGGPLPPDACGFSAESGGALCPPCREVAASRERAQFPTAVSLNALKSLRYLQGQEYAEARRLRLPAPLALEMEGLLRMYLRSVLEREVKSTGFLDHLRRGVG